MDRIKTDLLVIGAGSGGLRRERLRWARMWFCWSVT